LTDLDVVVHVLGGYDLYFILIFAVFRPMTYTTLDRLLAVFSL